MVTVCVETEISVVGMTTVIVRPDEVSVVKLAPEVFVVVAKVCVTVRVPSNTHPVPSQEAPGMQHPPFGLFGQEV
jgi:hypothetical protein